MEFAQEVARRDEDELVSRYRLSPVEAETLVPALLVYRALIDATAAQTIVVPEVSLRAGLLVDLVGGSAAQAGLRAAGAGEREDARRALPLRRRSRHARRAAGDATLRQPGARSTGSGRATGCCSRSRRCCTTSACSSACAATTSTRMYLLRSSEIFGLTRDDMQIVANIARYHRRGLPQKSHPEFMRAGSRRARARHQAGGHPAPGQCARRRAPAEGVRRERCARKTAAG